MVDNLISVITPCYNTGKYIHKLFESLLSQTYPYVEMFVVDDGSTDNTAEIIKSFIPRFEAKGYTLIYIYQKNQGQSVAINSALKMVKGEYLVWPDSDDFYDNPKALEKLEQVLSKAPSDYSMSRCLYTYYDESYNKKGQTQINQYTYNSDLFEDCLFDKNGYNFCPGGYMAKMTYVDSCIKGREIYTEKNAGQNWQLMLPLLLGHKCITLPEYLYGVVERSNSHSRGQYQTYEQQRDKFHSYENTIVETLKKMILLDSNEKDVYLKQIKRKYTRLQFNLAVNYHRHDIAKALKEVLNSKYNTELKKTEIIKFYLSYIPKGLSLYKLGVKFIHKLLRVLNN